MYTAYITTTDLTRRAAQHLARKAKATTNADRAEEYRTLADTLTAAATEPVLYLTDREAHLLAAFTPLARRAEVTA